MYYDRITRRVHLEIGGEEYLLAFTLGGLDELESKTDIKIIDVVQGSGVPPLKVLRTGFYIALRDGGNKHRYTRSEADELAQQFIDESENGVIDLANVFYGVFAASGFVGGDFCKQMFEQVGMEDKDPAPKNAKAARAKA